VIRNRESEEEVDIDFFNFDANKNPTIQRNRFTNEDGEDENIQYSVNFKKTFDTSGHEFTMDYQYSRGDELENSIINEVVLGETETIPTEQTIHDEGQINQLLQFDYVLPFGKDKQSQFEMGYRGTFNNFNTDFDFGILEDGTLQRVRKCCLHAIGHQVEKI
jgi:hypothetical protein